MIFAFATDDKSLNTFSDETEAIAYAEGIDVENGVWLFFASDGTPLKPTFPAPIKRSFFGTVRSGPYYLNPIDSPHAISLLEILPQVVSFEGKLTSLHAVVDFLPKS